MTWAKYEIVDKAIKISATVNRTRNNRSCSLILLDGEGNSTDTLEVVQTGKISSTNTTGTTRTVGTSTKSSRTSYGGQCAATTKKGRRCSRKAAAGSIYCWQHK